MIYLILKRISLILVIFFFGFTLARAEVFINEVQLYPTAERFIEIYNDGDSAVDLNDWYIQRKTANSETFTSLISKTNFIGKSIDGNSYFLISKNDTSNSDIVYGNLTLTESNTIQIKNSSGDIVDIVSWGCDYCDAQNPIEGNSLQKINGNWISAKPTPGEPNEESDNSSVSDDEEDEDNSEDSSDEKEEKVKIIKEPKYITKIIAPKISFAGLPFKLTSETTGLLKEKVIIGKYIWNFGDGNSLTVFEKQNYEYFYDYPGEYVITLEYFNRKNDVEPVATDRLTLKVVSNEVTISSVGDFKNPYVEIENKSNYEVFLSNWFIVSPSKYFTIPTGTVILPKKKIKFSSRITGFSLEDIQSLNLKNKDGVIVDFYPSNKKSEIVKKENYQKEIKVIKNTNSKEQNQEEFINLNNLQASSGDISNKLKSSGNIYPYLGLGVVIVLAILIFISLNKKEEDLERKIKAEDMTILE